VVRQLKPHGVGQRFAVMTRRRHHLEQARLDPIEADGAGQYLGRDGRPVRIIARNRYRPAAC
jgi:hypothetical protein